jgi:hypothetical protein
MKFAILDFLLFDLIKVNAENQLYMYLRSPHFLFFVEPLEETNYMSLSTVTNNQ